MRICEFNWSARVVAIKVAVVATAASFATAQSFDYPDGSPTMFQTGQQESVRSQPPAVPNALPPVQSHQTVTQHRPVTQRRPTQISTATPAPTSSLLSRVFGGKNEETQPTFGTTPIQVTPQRAQSGVQHSFHIDPYAINRDTPEGRNLGYQPPRRSKTAPRAVRPVGYEQPRQFEQSILDRSPAQQTPSFSKDVDPLLEQFENVQRKFNASRKLDSGTNQFDNTNTDKFIHVDVDRNTEAFALPSTRPAKDFATTSPQTNEHTLEQSTQPALATTATVVAPPATTPVVPTNAFKEEFEKAYRFIEPNHARAKTAAPRVAQLDIAPGELTPSDFDRSRKLGEIQDDFSNNVPSTIDVPEFIEPPQLEQSPNAAAPEFNPPTFNGEIDQLFVAPNSTNQTDLNPPATNQADLNPVDQNQFNRTSEFNPDFAPRIELAQPNEPPATKPDVIPPAIVPPAVDNSDFVSSKPNNESEPDVDEFGIDRNWKPPTAMKKPAEDTVEKFAQSSPQVSETQDNSAPSFTSSESPLWWKPLVLQPFHPENQTMPVDSNGLVFAALKNSPRIQAVSKSPLIRELQVVEADAEFDPVRFVQTQFQDRVDPVGNSLTIGGGSDEQFLKENIWTAEAGIRRKLRTGADVNFSQQLGFQNSNSINFTPQDQGTATLALNVSQPLLRGRGRYYNQAQILIAQSAGGVAWEVFQRDLQEELEGVVNAYWNLYLQRSIYLQRKRNVDRGEVILNRLTGRRTLDSLPAQISRAKSSVQTRRTELANAFRNVRNAETEIRRRIADRNWMVNQKVELLPNELPTIENVGLQLDQVVHTALNHRPEIREAMRQIKIAGVQRDVSENELLPELSFLVGTYVSALQGESDVLGAFADQFGQVTPGYSFGLEYELPRFNRAARSRFQQRHLQLQRLQNELEEVMQNVIAESQVSVRRIESAIETLHAANEAIIAARADVDQNEKRWDSFALIEGDIAEGVSPTTVLDQLLDSQERLSQTEVVYARAEQELKVAEVALQRSMGTLLMHERVSYDRTVTADTPSVHIQKN